MTRRTRAWLTLCGVVTIFAAVIFVPLTLGIFFGFITPRAAFIVLGSALLAVVLAFLLVHVVFRLIDAAHDAIEELRK